MISSMSSAACTARRKFTSLPGAWAWLNLITCKANGSTL